MVVGILIHIFKTIPSFQNASLSALGFYFKPYVRFVHIGQEINSYIYGEMCILCSK